MAIDFSKIGSAKKTAEVEPRQLFMSLPKKHNKYEYPRDVQSEVWEKWHTSRNKKDNIIKMNTGSGKTVVGLVVLQSCLNEDIGTAVYVVPNDYLINQTCEEAKKLGIKVTTDIADISFISRKSILVINIHKLVNGLSSFGLKPNNNIDIGSIIIDDVHACIETIKNQFTLRVEKKSDEYNEIIDLFKHSLKEQSEKKMINIISGSSYEYMLVPFWSWQEQENEIYEILHKQEQNNNDYKFKLPLLRDSFQLCNCMVSSDSIEIGLEFPAIDIIKNFHTAKRRIFMSATLADDSVFSSFFNVDLDKVSEIITPYNANDMGERLIIAPQYINSELEENQVLDKIYELSQNYNVVVLTPSKYSAKRWKEYSSKIVSTENIENEIRGLKEQKNGLTVFVNRYDGIDLPNESCRILVIDGIPDARSLYSKYQQTVTPENSAIQKEQLQKIEQGMGRGVRSNSDYCGVVLLGSGLINIIYGSNGMNYFSETTKAQYRLSEQLWEQLKQNESCPSLESVFSLLDYSLQRDENWIVTSKQEISEIKYSQTLNIDTAEVENRLAFNCAENKKYDKSAKILEILSNETPDEMTKGLIKQNLAKYYNFIDREQSQEILSSAKENNRYLLCPIAGIQKRKEIDILPQAQNLREYILKNQINSNQYVIKLNAVLETLQFSKAKSTYKQFEKALKDLSFLIGFYSERPEEETGRGPDNLWCLENNEFLVIECKNEAITETISKKDCNQLNGSIQWFNNEYASVRGAKAIPIMIHPSKVFEYSASPSSDIRIMTPDLLEKFKDEVLGFSKAFTLTDNYNDLLNIEKLLKQYCLDTSNLSNTFTTCFKK